MGHWLNLLYLFLIFINVLNCFVIGFLRRKYKNSLLKSFFYLVCLLTCFIIYSALGSYWNWFLKESYQLKLVVNIFGLIVASQIPYRLLKLFLDFYSLKIPPSVQRIILILNQWFILAVFVPAVLGIDSAASVDQFYSFQINTVFNFLMMGCFVCLFIFHILLSWKVIKNERENWTNLDLMIKKAMQIGLFFIPFSAADAFGKFWQEFMGLVPYGFSFSCIFYSVWAMVSIVSALDILTKLIDPITASDPKQEFFKKYSISEREQDVLFALIQGRTRKEIAFEYHISEYTAKNHIDRIYKKLGVHSREEAMRLISRFLDVELI